MTSADEKGNETTPPPTSATGGGDGKEDPTLLTNSSSTGKTSNKADEKRDVQSIKKLLTETKVSGGKSAWATTLETFGMAEGKKHRDDWIVSSSLEDALEGLKKKAAERNFEFQWTPMEDFNATKDDIYKAFCLWSKSSKPKGTVNGGDGHGDGNSNGDNVQYNISKAFRRLENYADWMDKNCQSMDLKGSTMKDIARIWDMKLTHDENGRAVWWIDVATLDLKKIKKEVNHDDILRYFVWLCHLVMFDASAQENGLVFVTSVGKKKGMMETLTCISMDVGTKMDRLSIGVLPIRMEAFVSFNNPGWMKCIMVLIRTFMSSKMRKRIMIIPAKEDPQTVFEKDFGKECIPSGIAGLTGSTRKDKIEEALENL